MGSYIIPSLWLPESDVLGRQPHDVSLVIDDTSSCASRAYIDTDVVIHLHENIVSRVEGVLPALLSKGWY